jgi:glycine cleavage system H protein
MSETDNLLFTSDHEWVRVIENRVVIGITDYAQDALGDVVFVQLPTTDDVVSANSTLSEVESTKSVSDIYAPVSGRVVRVNDSLANKPELVNSSPYGEGWIAEIEMSDPSELETLLTYDKYQQLINNPG